MMMSSKIKSIEFSADTYQNAYLKGCRKLEKYIAKNEYKNLSFMITKAPEKENTYIFTLYTNVDVVDEQRKFCAICKETHNSFFVNEQYYCSRCNMKAFLTRVTQKLIISKEYYKDNIEV